MFFSRVISGIMFWVFKAAMKSSISDPEIKSRTEIRVIRGFFFFKYKHFHINKFLLAKQRYVKYPKYWDSKQTYISYIFSILTKLVKQNMCFILSLFIPFF